MMEHTLESLDVLELASTIALKLNQDFLCAKDLWGLIDLLVSTLSTARSQYNARMPIGKLPDEILCSIFQFLRDDDGNEDVLWPMTKKIQIPRRLETLTHVCRRWRNVATSFPLLWSDIDVRKSKHDLFAYLLKLSQNVPLHLTVTSPSPLMQQMIRQHASRLREFNGFFLNSRKNDQNWREFQKFFFPSDDFEASQLESLTVSGFSTSDRVDPVTGVHDSDIAPPLLRGHAPHLKRLSLRHNAWLTGNQCTCLTHFRLKCDIVSVPSLLAFLSANPALEELILNDCLKNPNMNHSLSATMRVRLSNLRRLILGIRGTTYWDKNILHELVGHVEFGAETIIRLFVRHHIQALVLERIMITEHRQGSVLDIDTIVLVPCITYFSTIGLNKDSEHGFRLDERHGSPTSRALTFPRPMPSVLELWLPIPSSFKKFWAVPRLRALFENFPDLETLVLCQEQMQDFLEVFSDSLPPTCYPLKLKFVHVFLSNFAADSTPQVFGRFATMLSAWPCRDLTAFDVGFPTAEILEQFRSANVLPPDLPFTCRLKLFSEMPALKMPRASTTDTHKLWQSWADHFPLTLFN